MGTKKKKTEAKLIAVRNVGAEVFKLERRGDRFVMSGNPTEHSLCADHGCTDAERLNAHFKGYAGSELSEAELEAAGLAGGAA